MALSNLQFMPSLPVTLPEQRVLFRLGYVSGRTDLPEEQRNTLRRQMENAFRHCAPAGVWGTLKIKAIQNSIIRFEDGVTVDNDILSRKLAGCSAVWLGAVTIGPELGKYCADCFAQRKGSDAAVADAVGSETAEKTIAFLQHYAAAQLLRKGITMTDWRFSPGYSNWILDDQKKFFAWLHMEQLGITLTDSFIMHPEKSVTALAGLREPSRTSSGRQI